VKQATGLGRHRQRQLAQRIAVSLGRLGAGRRSWQRWGLALVGLALALGLAVQRAPALGISGPEDANPAVANAVSTPVSNPEGLRIEGSNYDLAQAAPFNRIDTYPVTPLPTAPSYRPNGTWIGRLALPSEAEYATIPGDWAWLEVWHAPQPELVGQRLRLTWTPDPAVQAYVTTVTRDVTFNEQAERFLANGNIVPVRLNGRRAVGPLQSLAGARPQDDVTVRLAEADVITEDGQPVIQTSLEPVQITGREYTLAQVLEPDTTVDAPPPAACPGSAPCPSEFFRIQHFNPASGSFDGPTETVRIPQQPRLKGERFFSTSRDLETSDAGQEGWYLYGSRDADGMFTVQALRPRALFRLQPQQTVLGTIAGLNYIDRQNWQDTPLRKGTAQSVLVSPNSTSPAAALDQWQEGDYALVIHLFGGIGGENKEFTPAGTVTGHFAYGLARVVRDPIADELQFDIQYQQVYAHNSGGIVSGTHDWASYTGDQQRGWLNLRPISDVVVKLDYFTQPLVFGNTELNLFRELLIQTQVMAARYRTGDGTGVAGVTPATSCVQDSNQALFIAIQRIRQQAQDNPDITAWLAANPDSPQWTQIEQFAALGQALADLLTPYGVIRADWRNNAETLAGIGTDTDPLSDFTNTLFNNKGLFSGALSWQTMMPRWGHDAVARVFLRHGAQLWFLRPNQVGGHDGSILPIPPTTLFGGIPVLGRVVQRFADAFAVPFTARSVGLVLVAVGVYALGAVPYGLRSGILRPQWAAVHPVRLGLTLVRLLVVPAFVEEVIFRVMLVPHPVEGVPAGLWLLWGLLSIALFVVYHALQGRLTPQRAVLADRRCLVLVGWLGLVLVAVYGLSGSLWVVGLVHWLVAAGWLLGMGGWGQLAAPHASPNSAPQGT